MKKKLKILIVRSRYNNTLKLHQSAIKELKKNKVNHDFILVNGAFEIPVTIARNIKKYDGFISIGIIIKGETPNFDFISNAITNGLIELSIIYKKPIGNAVLTCFNTDQAEKRSTKGGEAVQAVLDVLNPTKI
tara:strand:+ start:359 stop:757 length:399 start_codon:yes stop_codon:yes gene_type:complete